jgi:hypothetical protein
MCLGVSGEQQSGKTLIFLILGKILGSRHFVHLHSMKDMFGEFTFFARRIYVFLDECIWAGSHQDRNELKNMITADTERVRNMYSPTSYQKSCTNYGITSNEPWFLPAEDSDRRYFALTSDLKQLLDTPLYVQMFPKEIEVEVEENGVMIKKKVPVDPKDRINDYFTFLTSTMFDNNEEGLLTFA